jgi:uncharacterized MAPEG superfamily protein
MAPFAAMDSLLYVTAFTLLMWAPYILCRFYVNGTAEKFYLDGVAAVLSYGKLHGVEPEWSIKAAVAHRNACENLVCFAPLVLIAAAKGVNVDDAAYVYLLARLIHWPFCISGLFATRTTIFLVGWGACMAIVLKLL